MKINRLLIILLAMLGTLTGCYNKSQIQEKPDNLIPRDKMVNLIAESYIIESIVHTTTNDTVSKVELTKEYYRELFNRYHVTRNQYVTSIEYYVSEESSAEKLLSDASSIITKKKKALNLPDSVMQQPSSVIY